MGREEGGEENGIHRARPALDSDTAHIPFWPFVFETGRQTKLLRRRGRGLRLRVAASWVQNITRVIHERRLDSNTMSLR